MLEKANITFSDDRLQVIFLNSWQALKSNYHQYPTFFRYLASAYYILFIKASTKLNKTITKAIHYVEMKLNERIPLMHFQSYKPITLNRDTMIV